MTIDAPTGNVPVNIAPPQWQCPHCLHNFYSDLHAATTCAQAGPPAPAPDGVLVLVLPSHRSRKVASPAVFGPSQAGPVRAETVDDIRRHRRDLRVEGTVVDAREVAHAAPGELVILTDRHEVGMDRPVSLGPSGYGVLDRLFKADTNGRSRTTAPVWIAALYGEATWWRAPDEQERAALNMLTGDLLDRVSDLDVEAYAAEIEASYRWRDNRRVGRLELASAAAAIAVAEAHGATSHIWALRWLSRNAHTVAHWQAQAAIDWARGTGGPIAMVSNLQVSSKLPKNPGMKRAALMNPYQTTDYSGAMRALSNLMSVEAPRMPVPHLGDVTAELRAERKEVHRAR